MRYLLATLILVGVAFSLSAQSFSDSIRAFPEAEGYGAYVTGGRGGRIVSVTHTGDALNVTDAMYKGSLRAALSTAGSDPITIVFKCGGVIDLKSELKTSRSNMTIAGQTALGDGICIKGYRLGLSGQNVIIRHLRFRPGDVSKSNQPALQYENGGNFIIDHCSFSWSMEENMTVYDNKNTTIQWCILSESLYMSDHSKGARAYAAQWGGETATYHHNLLAHHNNRVPRQNGVHSNDVHVMFDYINNVHYNWGSSGAFYGGGVEIQGGYMHANIVGNYYKRGAAGANNSAFVSPSIGRNNETQYGYGQWWLAGNTLAKADGTTVTAPTADQTSTINANYRAAGLFTVDSYAQVAATVSDTAYKYVLLNSGALFPRRDAIDARIVGEVKTGTYTFTGIKGGGGKLGIIDSQDDTKPAGADASWDPWVSYYVEVDSTQAPRDADGDGMPDWYEDANGLDKNNAADARKRAVNKYTNLENYLNNFPQLKDGKQSQLITWGQLPNVTYGSNPIKLQAVASSGLSLTYSSSNTAVARVSHDTVYIVGVGMANIIATQAGNATYSDVEAQRQLVVGKGAQSISWTQALETMVGMPLVLNASASSGLKVEYTSNALSVARVSNDTLYAMKVGTAYITAKQSGSTTYNAASNQMKQVTVSVNTAINDNSLLPMQVYPNPASDVLNFRFEIDDSYSITLVDMSGGVVMQTTAYGTGCVVSVGAYHAGTYNVVVENSKKQRAVHKVVLGR